MKEPRKFKSYIEVKVVRAMPMTLGEYNAYRGWTIPPDEDPTKEGYLTVSAEGNHETWVPRNIFELHNRQMSKAEVRNLKGI